jgi:hypothetical protein
VGREVLGVEASTLGASVPTRRTPRSASQATAEGSSDRKPTGKVVPQSSASPVCSRTRGGSGAFVEVGEGGVDLRRRDGAVAVRDVETTRASPSRRRRSTPPSRGPVVVVVPGRVDVRADVEAGVEGVHVDGGAVGDAGAGLEPSAARRRARSDDRW